MHLQSPLPASRGRKGSPWRNMNREVQHKAGMAACCPILADAKPTETPQCKERRLEGHHVDLEYQSISGRKTSPSGMVSGLHVWRPVLGSHYLPSHRVTSPGAGREGEARRLRDRMGVTVTQTPQTRALPFCSLEGGGLEGEDRAAETVLPLSTLLLRGPQTRSQA